MSLAGRALLRATAPVLAGALAVTLAAEVPSPATAAPVVRAAASAASKGVDVRVATFNVQSVSVDKRAGNRRPWRDRRGTVISEILSEHVDVIGLQELNPSNVFRRRLVEGSNQMLDLRNGLNRRGGRYALNSNAAANCLNPVSTYHCRPRNRGASSGERILYNTRTMTLVRRGFVRYSRHSNYIKTPGLAYVVLRSKLNGHRFMFTTTHLDPPNRSVRASQWRQLIRAVKRIKGNLPVISVGDFNTQKFDPMTRTYLPAMRRAGFGDVLNQQYRVNPSRGVRAEHRVNAWINSNNRLSRDVRSYGYYGNHSKTGNSIDYIFASNSMRVKEFKVVLNFDPKTLRVRGTLPSDHNMLRATVVI